MADTSSSDRLRPDLADLRQAHERLTDVAHRTPVFRSTYFDRRSGAQVFFKAENLQRVGAFKFRGAYNTVSSLDADERRRGVVTHSSGNHGQAVALAAQLLGIQAHIVMPSNAPRVKFDAVAGYGAEIVHCEPTQQGRESTSAGIVEAHGAVLVHPYNDRRIIAGQGTAALEFFDQVDGLDLLLVPVGGGGLASGSALAAHFVSPGTDVVAAEPSGADDAARSLRNGILEPQLDPQTICDGLRCGLGSMAFDILQRHLHRIVTLDDDAIVEAMRHVFERLKLVIEPSAAVPVAALLGSDLDLVGRKVGIILSGGNVDLGQLPW